MPNWLKVTVGAVAIAGLAVATVCTGGAALSGAIAGGASGAVMGAGGISGSSKRCALRIYIRYLDRRRDRSSIGRAKYSYWSDNSCRSLMGRLCTNSQQIWKLVKWLHRGSILKLKYTNH